ncbi:MAG: enoyl-CoA hydratase-related protein [Gammaproteobacteria bacterium]|nr:enoyl-CoA hydratase-related protein [Gammaproteobacteria bacterium]
MDDIVLTHLNKEGILTITLNRPDKLNALNREVLEKLYDIVSHAEHDAEVKGLLITGSGKAFCAGADIRELEHCDAQRGYEFACFGQRVFRSIEQLAKPSIALINGVALGGGCELIQATTFRLAATTAKFGQPEVKLGVIPGYGGTQRLARLIGKGRALDLCLTGRMINAELALSWGLVSEVVEPTELLGRGQALMAEILQLAPLAIASVMEVIHRGIELPLDDALHLEALHFAKVCTSKDKAEGVSAFLEKRKANFTGA